MNDNQFLWKQYEKIRPFFDHLSGEHIAQSDRVSAFWKRMLDERHNFPSFNEVITFRREMATGIGYGRNIDEQKEREKFLLDFGRARSCVPLEFLQKYVESDVGHPYQYYQEGILSSPAGLHNATTAYAILDALRRLNRGRPEAVLEIGAGYGGVADVLIRNLSPELYVVCDLPQNLFLSAYYLSVNHPEYEIYFVSDTVPEDIAPRSFVFCLPAGVELLRNSYDLVVNTYSMQEMTLSEVNRYSRYIRDHLADDGLFYFLNHFTAAGAQRPIDYPFNLFKILSWGPALAPQTRFLHRKQSIEVVLGKAEGDHWPPHFESVSHVLALLMFMGVDENIREWCDELVRETIPETDIKHLGELVEVVAARSLKDSLARVKQMRAAGRMVPVAMYVSGLLKLFSRNYDEAFGDLDSAVAAGLSGFAGSRALAGKGLLCRMRGDRQGAEDAFREALTRAPQFTAELEEWDSRITLARFIRSYHFAFPGIDLEQGKLSGWLRKWGGRLMKASARTARR